MQRKNKALHHFLIAEILSLALLAGCVANGEDGSSSDAPITPTQAQLDVFMKYALNSTAMAIYNQNLAGKPVGNVSVTANCPLGGTVAITGSVSYASNVGVTTVNLTYVLSNCQNNYVSSTGIDPKSTSASTTLSHTLNGTATYTGSWDSANYVSTNFQSSNLAITGTFKSTNAVTTDINQTCVIALSSTSSGLTAEICGRTI